MKQYIRKPIVSEKILGQAGSLLMKTLREVNKGTIGGVTKALEIIQKYQNSNNSVISQYASVLGRSIRAKLDKSNVETLDTCLIKEDLLTLSTINLGKLY